MSASKAFSLHFICFLVDETHLHADLLLIKRLENSKLGLSKKQNKDENVNRKLLISDSLFYGGSNVCGRYENVVLWHQC